MGGYARIAAACLLALAAACAEDTNYPSRPVRLIVPFPAGGSSDIIARLISARAAQVLGQQIIIENRAGAGGNIGTEAAARATADGYTLVECTIGTCAINLSIYKGLSFDLERDFQPVVLFGSLSNVFTVHPSVPAKTVAELIDHARKNPGALSIGSSGYGSSPHLAAELLKQEAGVDIVHVPYRGSAPAIVDLLGGQIHMFFDNTPSILPHVESGALRALAVTGEKRLASLPDVPTMKEAGFPTFVIAPWFGALAPKKTPRAIIEKLNHAYNEAIADPELIRQFADMELIPGGGTPEAFQAHIRAEVKRWAELVKMRGIQAEALR